MSTFIGNQVNSLQVTESSVQINCDSSAAITLQIGTQNIDMHQKQLVNMAGFASEVSMNSYKITNLGVATSNGDALSRQTGDGRYYLNTTTLDEIQIPTSSLNANNQLVTNLANAQADSDALNRITADGRYYLNTVPLNNITAATGSLSLNSQKIINLSNPTQPQEAATKNYIDTGFYSNTTSLDQISLALGDINANGNFITNLATPISNNDAANKHYIDQNFYSNTTTLNDISAPVNALSLNSQKIINLGQPTGNNDAVTKTYADSTFYTNNTPLNSIQPPAGDISANSFKITNLASATVGTDALSMNAGDGRYYLNSTTLDAITIPTSALNINSQRLTDIADPVNTQDAASKNYVDNAVQGALDQSEADARYYLNTTTLDAITLPVSDVDLNAQKLTNVADPQSAQDAATKTYVDQSIAALVDSAPGVLDTLNELAAALGDDPNFATTVTNAIGEKLAKAGDTMTGDLNMGSNLISNLADPLSNTDAATKGYVDTQVATALDQTEADARYYLNTTTLNLITAPQGNVDMNSNRITNLQDPSSAQDAVTKAHADATFYANTVTLNNITAPSGTVNLNNQSIANVAAPVNNGDATNKQYVDGSVSVRLTEQQGDARYYLNTTKLNAILNPDGDVSINGYLLTNVANPVAGTDAVNKQTADNSYYGQAVQLNNITAPSGDLSMNSYKITTLAPATSRFDAVNYSQDLRWHWICADFTEDLTAGLSSSMVVPFTRTRQATLTDVSSFVQWDTDGVTLAANHYYSVQLQLEVEYTGGVNVPVVCQVRLADNATVVKEFTTNRAPALNTPQITTLSFVFNTSQVETIKMWLTNAANLSKITKNTQIFVQTLA